VKFSEFNIHENILKGIEDAGFTDCTEVQEMTLAETLGGRDVAVQSQTGTGKTAAFLITIFQLLCEEWTPFRKKALIVVPTRELAVQIEKEARLLGGHLDIAMGSIYGGVGYAEQEALLERDADIIIGTPGRLLDFSQSGKLKLKDRGFLVIDEADRLFDMGFLPDLRRMFRKMPPPDRRMTMLFSATLDATARELAWEHMNDPIEIKATPGRMLVEDVTQELYHVGIHEKMNLLLGLLKKENPRNVLIFTNTKHDAYEVSKRLECNGYRSTYMIGDLPQSKRLKIIGNLKSGKVRYLVATDVAARGLHVDDLQMVVNYDIPQDFENYVHRIGRTARAGRTGKAVSLACEKYVYGLEAIEKYIGMSIPVVWPEEDLLVPDVSSGKRFRMTDREREPKLKVRGEKREMPLRKRKKQAKEGPERAEEEKKRRREPSVSSGSKKQPKERTGKPPSGKKTREERIAYYREKYGEDFTVPAEKVKTVSAVAEHPVRQAEPVDRRKKSENPSFLSKVRRFFGAQSGEKQTKKK
jgi:ATP-dependent RNA helicase RhlB